MTPSPDDIARDLLDAPGAHSRRAEPTPAAQGPISLDALRRKVQAQAAGTATDVTPVVQSTAPSPAHGLTLAELRARSNAANVPIAPAPASSPSPVPADERPTPAPSELPLPVVALAPDDDPDAIWSAAEAARQRAETARSDALAAEAEVVRLQGRATAVTDAVAIRRAAEEQAAAVRLEADRAIAASKEVLANERIEEERRRLDAEAALEQERVTLATAADAHRAQVAADEQALAARSADVERRMTDWARRANDLDARVVDATSQVETDRAAAAAMVAAAQLEAERRREQLDVELAARRNAGDAALATRTAEAIEQALAEIREIEEERARTQTELETVLAARQRAEAERARSTADRLKVSDLRITTQGTIADARDKLAAPVVVTAEPVATAAPRLEATLAALRERRTRDEDRHAEAIRRTSAYGAAAAAAAGAAVAAEAARAQVDATVAARAAALATANDALSAAAAARTEAEALHADDETPVDLSSLVLAEAEADARARVARAAADASALEATAARTAAAAAAAAQAAMDEKLAYLDEFMGLYADRITAHEIEVKVTERELEAVRAFDSRTSAPIDDDEPEPAARPRGGPRPRRIADLPGREPVAPARDTWSDHPVPAASSRPARRGDEGYIYDPFADEPADTGADIVTRRPMTSEEAGIELDLGFEIGGQGAVAPGRELVIGPAVDRSKIGQRMSDGGWILPLLIAVLVTGMVGLLVLAVATVGGPLVQVVSHPDKLINDLLSLLVGGH